MSKLAGTKTQKNLMESCRRVMARTKYDFYASKAKKNYVQISNILQRPPTEKEYAKYGLLVHGIGSTMDNLESADKAKDMNGQKCMQTLQRKL